jgi:hypothetical protein
MKILILGEQICNIGEFEETESAVIHKEITYPKHTIEGYEIIEVQLPDDFSFKKYIWQNDFVVNPNWIDPDIIEETTEETIVQTN